MPEVVIEDSQYKLFSGHLHITSEKENNKRYNITTTLKGSRSTHTYLLGKDMEEMGEILKTKGSDIFKAWSFDNTTHGVTDNALKLTLYKPDNNMWSECRKDGESVRLLTSIEEKEQIFDSCFTNLRFIFCNIFHILKYDTFPSTASTYCLPDVVSVKKITKPTPGGASSSSSSSSTDTYLEYKVPKSTNYNNKINLSYYDTDNIVKFNGIINVNDLKNKKDPHSKPLSHTDTHHSVHSYSRSPPLGYSRSPPLGYSRSPPLGYSRSPPLGYSRSPPRERMPSPPRMPRIPRERMPSPPRMPRIPRERMPSPPRMPRVPRERRPRIPRIPSPPRMPRRVMPIETRIDTRGEKRNVERHVERHVEPPFWGRVVRRRG
jgi:hypothetical protein